GCNGTRNRSWIWPRDTRRHTSGERRILCRANRAVSTRRHSRGQGYRRLDADGIQRGPRRGRDNFDDRLAKVSQFLLPGGTMTAQASRKDSGRPYKSNAVINTADVQPAASRNHPLAYRPMRFFELVKCNSGNMANGNCIASTT